MADHSYSCTLDACSGYCFVHSNNLKAFIVDLQMVLRKWKIINEWLGTIFSQLEVQAPKTWHLNKFQARCSFQKSSYSQH